MSQVSLQRATSPTSGAKNRASMPPMSRGPSAQQGAGEPMSPTSSETQARASKQQIEPMPEENEEEVEADASQASSSSRGRTGTMNKEFKFPSSGPSSPTPPVPPLPTMSAEQTSTEPAGVSHESADGTGGDAPSGVLTPTQVEVPPPPPVEKERSQSGPIDEGDDDLGVTEEIPL
jgi:chitin biosynthesis protein CHS5